jgi:hypothetical protein
MVHAYGALGARKSEAQVIAPERRSAAAPIRGTQVLSAVAPASAAKHAVSPRLRTLRVNLRPA